MIGLKFRDHFVKSGILLNNRVRLDEIKAFEKDFSILVSSHLPLYDFFDGFSDFEYYGRNSLFIWPIRNIHSSVVNGELIVWFADLYLDAIYLGVMRDGRIVLGTYDYYDNICDNFSELFEIIKSDLLF
jgi:hypothetical protein